MRSGNLSSGLSNRRFCDPLQDQSQRPGEFMWLYGVRVSGRGCRRTGSSREHGGSHGDPVAGNLTRLKLQAVFAGSEWQFHFVACEQVGFTRLEVAGEIGARMTIQRRENFLPPPHSKIRDEKARLGDRPSFELH